MKHRVAKALAALGAGGVLAGCATTVDMGGPLLHYRYHYDSRPVISESTVTVPAPTVSYREPAVTYRYREPVVTDREPVVTYPAPAVTYRESSVVYREPATVTYYGPAPIYALQPSPSLPYTDRGQ
jgi:hypothetical protein